MLHSPVSTPTTTAISGGSLPRMAGGGVGMGAQARKVLSSVMWGCIVTEWYS